MKLTGKCKEDFEKWLSNQELVKNPSNVDWSKAVIQWFQNVLTDSMQWGVYVDFFIKPENKGIDLDRFMNEYYAFSSHTDKSHSRKLALEKASKIYNKCTGI